MDCPQCEGEGTLTTFTDGEREAVVCEDCGYVGIPADHSGEGREVETWADAVDRFHEVHPFLRDGESPGAETPVGVGLRRPERDAAGPTTWDEALRAFENGDAAPAGDDVAGATGSDEAAERNGDADEASDGDGAETAAPDGDAARDEGDDDGETGEADGDGDDPDEVTA